MRFATRTFLWSFGPSACLLLGSFWAIEALVVSTVRDGLRSSLRDKQISLARMHAKGEIQNSRFLRIVGESAALKAGLLLMRTETASEAARLTVEDQLQEICQMLGFDFLLVRTGSEPIAGVIRSAQGFESMDLAGIDPPQRGFYAWRGNTYQVTSVPVNQADENLALLSVGERFDFSDLSAPAILLRNGHVLMSNVPDVSAGEIEKAFGQCGGHDECTVKLRGQSFLSLPLDSIYFGDGYWLRGLQNIDSASRPVQAILGRVFAVTTGGALLAALFLSIVSSRSIVEPIAKVVAHLRTSGETGDLPEFRLEAPRIQEIRALTQSFNQAAAAVREGRSKLEAAYIEFVESLASALDARDPYTAGHSRRVSEYSQAIGNVLGLDSRRLQILRVGALLHDIGKIGVDDQVLRKADRLTPAEFALIQEHPAIGRRILEGVHGFQDYLPIVELHHENWDGTGYPLGLQGAQVPLEARIVHVADAYDAMTSDRPYREGMTHRRATEILAECAGTQFDPGIVAAFIPVAEGQYLRLRPAQGTGMGETLDQLGRHLEQPIGLLDRTGVEAG